MADDQRPPSPGQPQAAPAEAPPGGAPGRPQGPPQGGPQGAPQGQGGGGEPKKDPAADAKRKAKRGRLFLILAIVIAVAALAYLIWWFLVGSHFVKTDDAYVGASVVQITPQVSGQVSQTPVGETQPVKAGQVLVVIDPADARLAEAQAEAQYGQAVRRVRQLFANNQAYSAQVGARQADLIRAQAQIRSAQSDVDRTKVDFDRRQALANTGAVSGEELTNARNAYQTAQANLAAAHAAEAQAVANQKAAQGQLAAQTVLTEGADVNANPEVAAAKAQLDTAKLNLERTVIRSPIDGIVARRQVEVGQRVSTGASLMTVVPIAQAYVDANFKEVQLKKVRIGQAVELESDLYGKHVVFHGRITGIGGGTGSAFAVIPAQNATGNWIKVVQRLPVRIGLDPQELQQHPLRVGLSMSVRIDITQAGDPNASAAAGAPRR